MSRRFLTTLASALLAAALVVAGSAIAAGGKTKTIKLKGTIHAHASGEGSKIAGTTKDKYNGAGAIVYNNAAAGTGVTTKYTSFGKNGSFHGTTTADITINPDTTITISHCTFKITGGGGAYKGAKGSGTCAGSGDKNGYDTITYKGKMKVRK